MNTKHKWHKEIKAWADGAEIEVLIGERWVGCFEPIWSGQSEYRIKPQPKEPQYLYVYGNGYATLTSLEKSEHHSGLPLKAKIKLEVDDED